ncbi:putative polysaccharide biosynthesis protein [Brevibacillus laterosporus]|uniref:putative polysaccharide biosynthesis protein n=1 Tax=Brevibacillus laterosporus TaxID=1465 RepID=UPI00264F34C0|nr:polysaccharide biosynthesis protein [Brevibacillus laterosporus]MDN9011960.1 polysaccharide biosynthesis protein [Brevibacillus laterosporus]MDO0943056.1 polysaccharide biosynthesis protein [Brevibacillus laterosporus]
MAGERSANHFVKGAAILGIAGLLSKVLGAIYRIPYQNITGDVGLYVYMQVYPLYTALLILATAGFPIAISKIVSERLAVEDHLGARKAFRVASVSLGILGVFFFLLLYLGAPALARFMGDEQLTLPLRAVAWSLPLVPLVSILRGYFQGQQDMVPTGVSQVVEQIIRVIVILVSAYWMMSAYQDAYLAGTGAVFAAFPGALAAFLVLYYYYRKSRRYYRRRGYRKKLRAQQLTDTVTNKQVLISILHYAIPICIGALVLPMIPLIDSVTVSNLLQWNGYELDTAKELKGIYDRGQPLIQFGTFFATSLSLALVPAISEAVAQKQDKMIINRTEMALRLTLMLGLPASIGLALLAEPVNIMVYGNDKGTWSLAIQAFVIVFATLSIATSGILQGLGHVKLPARHLLIGVLVKLLANLALTPLWGIQGAAVATVLAYVTSMGLNMRSIRHYLGLSFNIKEMLTKPLISVALMSIMVLLVQGLMNLIVGSLLDSERLVQTIVGVFAVSVGLVVYMLSLLYTGGIKREEILYLPKGKRLVSLLERYKLLQIRK